MPGLTLSRAIRRASVTALVATMIVTGHADPGVASTATIDDGPARAHLLTRLGGRAVVETDDQLGTLSVVARPSGFMSRPSSAPFVSSLDPAAS